MSRPGPVRLGQLALVLSLALAAFAWAQPGGLPLAQDQPATQATPDRSLEANVTAVPCPESYDNGAEDDICLAYAGQIPGPTWILEQGEQVELTFDHDVNDSLEDLDVESELADELSQARYSLHRHGVSVAACEDGVARPVGTEICGSTVGPEDAMEPAGSVTYAFEAAFAGPWHYHDHSTGVDVGTAIGPVLGEEAVQRGLFGSFLVLAEGQQTDHAFDLHLLDAGPNGGMGLDETVEAGERFDLVVVGLGNHAWDVSLHHEDQGEIGSLEIGPGLSRVITVEDAQEGSYTWQATSALVGSFEGEVVAQ